MYLFHDATRVWEEGLSVLLMQDLRVVSDSCDGIVNERRDLTS